jgi:hypothetical protein
MLLHLLPKQKKFLKQKSQCSVIDITELKKVEKALNDSVGELSLVNEKLGVVGALTRHDVRNKLAMLLEIFS